MKLVAVTIFAFPIAALAGPGVSKVRHAVDNAAVKTREVVVHAAEQTGKTFEHGAQQTKKTLKHWVDVSTPALEKVGEAVLASTFGAGRGGPQLGPVPFAGARPQYKFGCHKCKADSFDGHYFCSVHGVNFMDAQEAFVRLKMDDCCPTYVQNNIPVKNGKSIEFRMMECRYWK